MPSVFAAVFIALYVAHHVGDHWIQTAWQAANKSYRTFTGRVACFAHVATLTLTKALFLGVVCLVLDDVHLNFWWTALALTVDAATHYWCDRRFTLKKFAELIQKDGYWDFCTVVRKPGKDAQDTGPGTGSFHLDQSFHLFWIGVAALAIAATA